MQLLICLFFCETTDNMFGAQEAMLRESELVKGQEKWSQAMNLNRRLKEIPTWLERGFNRRKVIADKTALQSTYQIQFSGTNSYFKLAGLLFQLLQIM